MFSDYEYRSDEAEEGETGEIDNRPISGLLPDDERSNERSHGTSASHYYVVPDAFPTASRLSPVRHINSHCRYANTTINVGKDVVWSCNTIGHRDATTVVGPERTDVSDVAVYTDAVREKSSEKEENNNNSAASRFDVYKRSHSTLCNRHQDGRAALLSSSHDVSWSYVDYAQIWTDDEEPELRNLVSAGSSTDKSKSNNSNDYEKRDERYNDEPYETPERSDSSVHEDGTFEEECLSSSTYFFDCSNKDDDRG